MSCTTGLEVAISIMLTAAFILLAGVLVCFDPMLALPVAAAVGLVLFGLTMWSDGG